MADDEKLPVEVQAFLLVGRVVEAGQGATKRKGVVKYCWTKFGKGGQHVGFPAFYPLKEGEKKATPMDTEFTYAVFWEGPEEEREIMGLEEVQAIATAEFTDAEWLPKAIRCLQRDDWGLQWEQLDGDNAAQFLQKIRLEAVKAAAKAATTTKRTCSTVAGPSGLSTKSPPKQNAAKKCKEKEPLAKPSEGPTGLAAQLQAKAEARKRSRATSGASGNAGSPAAKRSKVLDSLLRPLSKSAEVATRGMVPAAISAGMVPSESRATRDEAFSNACRQGVQLPPQQQQQQAENASCVVAGPSAKQRPAGKGKAAATSNLGGGNNKTSKAAGENKAPAANKAAKQTHGAGKAPASSKKGKQVLLPPMPLLGGSGSGRAAEPLVLRQHENDVLVPANSKRLYRVNWEDDYETVDSLHGKGEDVYWFDRVLGKDGCVYRVWSNTLIVPESLCYKTKSDMRLHTWKVKTQDYDDDAEYVVEALLAEREDEDGQTSFFVKWRGYEVDPADGGWLTEEEMEKCRDVLQAWQLKGRQAWQDACHSLCEEAGLP